MAYFGWLIAIAVCASQFNVLVLSMQNPVEDSHVRLSSNLNAAARQQFYHATPAPLPVDYLLPPQESTLQSAPSCEPRSFGRHPIPFDCSKYLRCWNGNAELITCRTGMLFNDDTKLCERAANVRCSNQIEATTHMHHEHVHSRQSASRMIDLRAAPRSGREKLVEPLEVHEFGNIPCRASNGLEPHPTDCDKFLNCANGNGVVQQCGPGTVFNERLFVCDWPYNVDCSRYGGSVFGEYIIDVRSGRSEHANDDHELHQVRPTLSADQLYAVRNYALEVKPIRKGAPEYPRNDEGSRGLELTTVPNNRRSFETVPGYDEEEGQQTLVFGQTQNGRSQWDASANGDNGQETVSIARDTINPIASNRNARPLTGFYVHQTTPTTSFDNQLANSRRFNQYAQRNTVPMSTTTTPASIPTMSSIDQEYQRSLEQRIRNRNTPNTIETSSTTPRSPYIRAPILNEPEVAVSDQWDFLTVTQTQPQPNYSNDRRSYSARRLSNEDDFQTTANEDVQRTYSSLRQANTFAGQPHQTSATNEQSRLETSLAQLLKQNEETNQRRTVPSNSNPHQPIISYAAPTEWNTDSVNPTYSNPPAPEQFASVAAAELEASLRVLDSYISAPTVDSTNKQHVIPIYNRYNQRQPAAVYVPDATPTASARVVLPTDINADHINEAIKMMLQPYRMKVNASSVDSSSLTSTLNSTDSDDATHQDKPSYRSLSDRRNDLDLTEDKFERPKWQYERTTAQPIDPIIVQECQFDCKGNGRCVPYGKVCNGVNDCGNFLDEQHCPNVNFQVRLVNGTAHNGLLEVHVNSRWGLVCDTEFGMTEAHVVCKELGFSLGALELLPQLDDGTRPANDGRFQMDAVKCSGHETSLKQCTHLGWGVHQNCSVSHAIGVVCNDPAALVKTCDADYWLCEKSNECAPISFVCDGSVDCEDGSDEDAARCAMALQYRLADGNSSLMGDIVMGRVEVRKGGVWGSVCSNGFGQREAKVFCNSMGYNGTANVTTEMDAVGHVWLDQVHCIGSELTLDLCRHNEFGNHNCDPRKAASVVCSKPQPRLKPKDKQLRPTNANDLHNQGTFSLPEQCGQIQVQDVYDSEDAREGPVYRVIAGKVAKHGHHPWQASIRTNGAAGGSAHECGAVVISPIHVLTAAHCVKSKLADKYYSVRVGDHLLDDSDPLERNVAVKRRHIHKQFRAGRRSNNDIAIVVLQEALEFNNMVQPICLPAPDAAYSEGHTCTISGWGSIRTGVSGAAKELRAGQVPLISDAQCRHEEVYGTNLTANMFCAGFLEGNTADACGGDSGGPLACEENGIHRLYGIVSWGVRCGEPNRPGVYVKIAQYIDWIHNTINSVKV